MRDLRYPLGRRSLLELAGAALLLPGLLGAQRTIYVDATNPKCPGSGTASDPYCRIQAAIDAAAGGDTVLVSPGTYDENLDFLGKAIAVRGKEGPRQTTIDAGRRGSGVKFVKAEGRTSILEGFTVQNGTGTPIQVFNATRSAGGGILCQQASPTLANLVLTSNSAVFGGGICCYQSASPALINLALRGNNATSNGGGACFMFDCRPLVSGCVFTGNSCGHTGGGANFRNSSFPVFTSCVFDGNTARDMGGGIRVGALSGSTITSCTFYRNTSVYGGGLATGSDTAGNIQTTLVRNSIFWLNSATYGPELSLNGGYPAILDVGHSDVAGGQAGVYVQSASFVLIWGSGMLAADPAFLDPMNGDFHLRYSSPCRNNGSNAAAALPGTDFEGDPRVADTTTDIGADEVYPHLYQTGSATPGGKIVIHVTGRPSAVVAWLASPSVLDLPVRIPGIDGLLHLDPRQVLVAPLGLFGAEGFVKLPVDIPLAFPRIDVPGQALVGLQLTNLDVVRVR